MPHLLFIPLMLAAFAILATSRPSFAQADMPVSQCQMIARSLPSFTFAGFSGAPVLKVQSKADEEVRITYVGHSTFAAGIVQRALIENGERDGYALRNLIRLLQELARSSAPLEA